MAALPEGVEVSSDFFNLNANKTEKEVNLQRDTYPSSTKARPREQLGGGSGTCCCIPGCGSAFYDKYKNKAGIGLFKIPSDKSMRRKWMSFISRYRRRGGVDNFKVTNATVVCEFHFKLDEILVSKGIGRKTLVRGSVPCAFKITEQNQEINSRKPPTKRLFVETSDDEANTEVLQSMVQHDIPEENNEEENISTCEQCQFLLGRVEALEKENTLLLMENNDLRLENSNNKENLKTFQAKHIYRYENISNDKHHFKSATGLELEVFDNLLAFLNPGKNAENIKFYDASNREKADTMPSTTPNKEKTPQKRGPKPGLSPVNQLFLLLVWLKCGFSLSHTAWLFDTPKSTVSRYLITWVNLLYFSLGGLPIWPTKQQVQETMPECFKTTYPTTRCIIDCTELFCQSPSSLSIQSSLFSYYKHHVTYKGLLGITPSGAITFISQLHSGSVSDKEIVKRSGLLNKELWDDNDAIMADRGFTIEEELSEINVQLNIPAFLEGREQLTEAEVKESQLIASVRIHVECAIQRVKKFKQIRNEIPLVWHGSINQIWTVACLLCNLLPPLIQKGSNEVQPNPKE